MWYGFSDQAAAWAMDLEQARTDNLAALLDDDIGTLACISPHLYFNIADH